jgi:hypothetical protein
MTQTPDRAERRSLGRASTPEPRGD